MRDLLFHVFALDGVRPHRTFVDSGAGWAALVAPSSYTGKGRQAVLPLKKIFSEDLLCRFVAVAAVNALNDVIGQDHVRTAVGLYEASRCSGRPFLSYFSGGAFPCVLRMRKLQRFLC